MNAPVITNHLRQSPTTHQSLITNPSIERSCVQLAIIVSITVAVTFVIVYAIALFIDRNAEV